MASPGDHPELSLRMDSPSGLSHINGRCLLQTRDERRVVSVAGIVIAQYAVGDRMSEAHAMVNLVEQGHADQNDVARAFGCSTRTVRRCQERFAEGGLPALARTAGYPKGRCRLPEARNRVVSRLKAEGRANREIARRLGVDEKAIRKQLKRLGWREEVPEQPVLALTGGADPNLSAFPAVTVDDSPAPSQQSRAPDIAGDARRRPLTCGS